MQSPYTRRRVAAVTFGLVFALGVSSLVLFGCGPGKAPSSTPGIVGAIQTIEPAGDGWAALVVGGKQAPGAVSDRAMCRITPDTTIVDASGSKLAPAALKAGDEVAVWFTGPVAESYPVQGTADYIEVRSAK